MQKLTRIYETTGTQLFFPKNGDKQETERKTTEQTNCYYRRNTIFFRVDVAKKCRKPGTKKISIENGSRVRQSTETVGRQTQTV